MRLNRVEPILRRALRGPSRLPAGSRLLVALSGGADSTALLLGLHRVAREFALGLHAAHLDHGLRGAASAADHDFAGALCARLGIPFSGARWDTRRRMARRGLSGQAGLRQLRREYLIAAARRAGAVAIATAHTADDQLETVLLRLLRGTGLRGLGGMRPRAGAWIKPLLGATRAEIEADLNEAGQEWREDGSNGDLAYARNRLRHGAVPALIEALGIEPTAESRSALARRFARAAREARDADRALRSWISPLLPRLARIQGTQFELDSDGLGSYPRAFRRTVFGMIWSLMAPDGPGLTHDRSSALDQLLAGRRGGRRALLPRCRCAERIGGVIRFRSLELEPPSDAVFLAIPSRTEWRGSLVEGRWTSGRLARAGLSAKSMEEEYFAAEGLQGRLEVRAGRADEQFVPYGRRSPVRLGRFLSKQRVSWDPRQGPGVLADSGGILWVIGVRRSARAPVTNGTRRVLWVHAERP